MPRVGEGVEGYPRWDGYLSTGRTWPVILGQEIRRTWEDLWGRIAITVVIAYALVFIGSLQSAGSTAHSYDTVLLFVGNLRWGALALAAIMAGPALLEDRLQGSLELYLSRAVTRADYLAGKIGATFSLTTVAIVVPAIIYWVVTLFLFTDHPARWTWFLPAALVYGLIWAGMVTGVGLGLACISRSSRAAALILFGAFAVADVLVANVLEGITRAGAARVISPLAAHGQQVGWLFTAELPFAFPFWWGLVELAVLAALGWALVWWKHPRLAGVD